MRRGSVIVRLAMATWFLAALIATVSAQDFAIDSSLVGQAISVQTSSGASFQGTVASVSSDRIELIVSDGQIIQVARSRITGARILDTAAGQRSFYEDSAANRLVVMPTAFPMERGEFQVASQEIVAVTASYGINDWLSVWGGISIPGALFSLRASAHVVSGVGVSAGSFVGASWLDLSLGPLVMPYALVSFGELENNVTVGTGMAMMFNDGFDIPGAVVAFGAKRTLNATSALVSENWVVWGKRAASPLEAARLSWVPQIVAPSLVFRIASSRLSWDIGAVVPFFIGGDASFGYSLNTPVIPIPVLSVTYRIQ